MNNTEKSTVIELMEGAADMTIATVRPDGSPQATTVSYVNDGLTIYFGTSTSSQKTNNLELNDKVSLTINSFYRFWKDIRGLSIAGTAKKVEDADEFRKVSKLLYEKFPQVNEFAKSESQEIAFFRVEPTDITYLDYRKGLGHTERFCL
jgi:general stress protein 26